jgi:hypothetical protein
MGRISVAAVLATVLAFGGATLSADSRPALSGGAAGIELCPQFICGFALFAGTFEGEVNSRPASGGFVAAIVHDDLPAIDAIAAINGGQWTITAGRRVFSGAVRGGTIYNVNGTQFCINMALEIDEGGRGEIYFSGVLDHGPFPPTIAGLVTQSPNPGPCPVFTR